MISAEPSQEYRGVAYLNSGYRRGLDILISLVLFVPVHAVLALAWLAVRLRGQTSFLYIQERIGRGGHPFSIYKVRTIRTNHPSAQEFTHTPNDLLPLGAFLRRWRIDELPQIWNVLRGQMSWIGPRPEVPFHYHQCAQALMGYEDRQLVLPGIT
ncbi:MAG: sugar transferase, partial [Bacteroidota bacterium]